MIRRTREPFRRIPILGRLFWVPLTVAKRTPFISFTPTHEVDGEHRWGPTVVVRLPFRRALGFGVWLNSGIADLEVEYYIRQQMETETAAYDLYCAINGKVDRDLWATARDAIAAQGLDPDEEMEAMQNLGVFG